MTKSPRLIKVFKDQNLACLACEQKNLPVARLLGMFGLRLYLCQACMEKAFADYEEEKPD